MNIPRRDPSLADEQLIWIKRQAPRWGPWLPAFVRCLSHDHMRMAQNDGLFGFFYVSILPSKNRVDKFEPDPYFYRAYTLIIIYPHGIGKNMIPCQSRTAPFSGAGNSSVRWSRQTCRRASAVWRPALTNFVIARLKQSEAFFSAMDSASLNSLKVFQWTSLILFDDLIALGLWLWFGIMIMIWDYDYDYDLGYYDSDPIPIIDLGLWKNVQSPASCRRGLVSSCLQHVEASQDSTGRVVCVHQGWQAKDLGEVWKIHGEWVEPAD